MKDSFGTVMAISKICIWCGKHMTESEWKDHPLQCPYFIHIIKAHENNDKQR